MRAHRLLLYLPGYGSREFWPVILSQPLLWPLGRSLTPPTFSTKCSPNTGFFSRMVPYGGFPFTSVLRNQPQAPTPDHSHAASSGLSCHRGHTHTSLSPAFSLYSAVFPLFSIPRKATSLCRIQWETSGANKPSLTPPCLGFPPLRFL